MASPKATFTITAVDRTQQAFNSANNNLKQIGRTATQVTGLIAGVGVAVGKSAQSIARFGDTTRLLGLSSTEALQEIVVAGEQIGITFETTATALQRLARRAQDAATGNNQLADAFAEFGLQVEDLQRLSPDELFLEMSKNLEAARASGVDLTSAMSVLDVEGIQLLRTMEQLQTDGFQEAISDMERMGLIMDTDLVQSSQALREEYNTLTTQLETGLVVALTKAVAISDKFWDLRRQAGQASAEWLENTLRGISETVLGFDILGQKIEEVQSATTGRSDSGEPVQIGSRSEQAAEENLKLEALAKSHTDRMIEEESRRIALVNEQLAREQQMREQAALGMLAGAARNSKLFFEIDKVRSLAQGALQAKEAVIGAYAWGNKIGGPPFGAAMAAVAGAASATYLAAIASSSYGASTSASTGGGGGSSELPAEQAGRTSQQRIEINFQGGTGLYDENTIRRLIDTINEVRENGDPSLSGRAVVVGGT